MHPIYFHKPEEAVENDETVENDKTEVKTNGTSKELKVGE